MSSSRAARRASRTVQPFTHARRQQLDWLDLMQRQHTIDILLEVDVTHARRSLKAQAPSGAGRVSFTAFLVWCVARAVEADKQMHACRQGRNRLVVFDDVDITVLVERQVEGQRIPAPYVIRAANRKQPAGYMARSVRHRLLRLHNSRPYAGAPVAESARWPAALVLDGSTQ